MATTFLNSIESVLPAELASRVAKLCTSDDSKATLENVLRFAVGAPSSLEAIQPDEWSDKQAKARTILAGIVPYSSDQNKRPREDGGASEDAQDSKRARTSIQDRGSPLFTLHSISATSPVRKKTDIKIYASSVAFENPATHAVETEIPVQTLTRAFVLPTRGKSKPHWTVVLLTADAPSAVKGVSNQQVIFGIDAKATTPITTTGGTNEVTHKKGSETLPILREFLSHLPIPLLEPSVDIFRSSTEGPGPGGQGVPGIQAYRGAKAGSLWFMREGILWGESKPCEFWSIGDLINRTEGLRIIGGTGRTCSVVLTRRPMKDEAGDGDDDEADEGEETQFGVIDAKEQDPINGWVRNHRHLFGPPNNQHPPATEKSKARANVMVNTGKVTLASAQFDESDGSDVSFEADSDDSEGSGSDSGDETDNQNGSAATSPQEDDAESSDGGDDMDTEELDPAQHPLLRPGAVPRMSRAAMDMVVGMVEQDMLGAQSKEEEDELDD
ncbi:hypothetical protein PC9H_011665 [Pleurotus ostreatus]|uniref:Histone chaperone RTT106/FACT complex subunit SPT16-like middle domain-containing protein n=1 Tax=Pleurotus ostreatus TaxID=5322 RepID=A0A8H6ZM97_PLEOS|nr:uncharacterized protein PC9H_011665 [Pleurotus ostreatus]KAF7421145.1 hypothetical protein PC9H_011665 [Pleurotus ostreatus]KAJ8690678.1 hypothetical protein PTI98_012087 [Pleurotus ostreatus]